MVEDPSRMLVDGACPVAGYTGQSCSALADWSLHRKDSFTAMQTIDHIALRCVTVADLRLEADARTSRWSPHVWCHAIVVLSVQRRGRSD